MDDDANRFEVDARLREILKPPRAAIDRVVAGALGQRPAREPLHRWRWVAVTAVALFMVVVVTWQRTVLREPRIPVITVSRDVSMFVVQSSDGRRWFFTPRAAPGSGGHYVIVVPE
jgi:hypothetical protein